MGALRDTVRITTLPEDSKVTLDEVVEAVEAFGQDATRPMAWASLVERAGRNRFFRLLEQATEEGRVNARQADLMWTMVGTVRLDQP